MGRLDGKVALITGAGSGFGEAIAHGFVSEGAHVLVADIAVANGKRVVEEIGNKKYPGGGSSIFVEFNVTQRSDWEKALRLAKSEFGKLDIVVNNAGTTYKKKPSIEVTDDEFDKIIAVNIKGIFLSVTTIMPYFVERKAGVYLNTSSVAGTRVRPGQVFYGGSKGFLNTVCLPGSAETTPLIWRLTHFIGNSRPCCGIRTQRCPSELDMSTPWGDWSSRDVQWSAGYAGGEGEICTHRASSKNVGTE